MTAFATASGRFEQIRQLLTARYPLWGDSFDAWKMDLQRLTFAQFQRGMVYLRRQVDTPGDIQPTREQFLEVAHGGPKRKTTPAELANPRKFRNADPNLARNVLADLRAELEDTQNRHRQENQTNDPPGTPTIAQHLAGDRSNRN